MWKNVIDILQTYSFVPMVACIKSDGVFQKRMWGTEWIANWVQINNVALGKRVVVLLAALWKV